MSNTNQLKLKADGSYADRAHYIMNTQLYIEYWMSIPTELKPTTSHKIKQFFYKTFKK